MISFLKTVCSLFLSGCSPKHLRQNTKKERGSDSGGFGVDSQQCLWVQQVRVCSQSHARVALCVQEAITSIKPLIKQIGG